MKLSLIISFLCMATLAGAADVVTTSTTIHRTYNGTIGSYKVHMNLDVTGTRAKGEFFYKADGPAIQLAGSVDNRTLKLTASYAKMVWGDLDKTGDANLLYGQWDAALDGNGNIKGSVSSTGKEAYNISLSKIFEATSTDSTLHTGWKNTDPNIKADYIYTLEMKGLSLGGLPDQESNKDLNEKYGYKITSYMLQHKEKTLNEVEPKRLAQTGLPSGADIVKQMSKVKSPGYPYLYENGNALSYLDNRVLSVQNDILENNGAAHEFSQVTYDNYNIRTGALLTLDSLFIKGGKFMLDSMGDFCFRKQMGLGDSADFRTAGYFFAWDKFHANTNFYFTINGICFVYNKYEIAPYSAGVIKVIIPYRMLKMIIRADGPLGWVLHGDE